MVEKQEGGGKIEVVYRYPADLKPDPKNPHRHSKRQLQQLAKSIESFGFNVAILIDQHLNVIAGHGRLEAAKLLGLTEVPTIILDHLSPLQIHAFMIADNKLAESATWDDSLLAEQLKIFGSVDLDFDLEALGFDLPEIDLLIGSAETANIQEPDPEPELPSPPAAPISRIGDLCRPSR